MKKIMLWVFAATFICGVSTFTSCCSTDDDDNSSVNPNGTIAMIVKEGEIEYFKQIEHGFRQACTKNNLGAEYYSTSSEYAYEEQISAVKELERKNLNLKGIIYAPCKGLDGKSADAEVAALARKLNIPVINIDSRIDATGPLVGSTFIGTDNEAIAKMLAEKVTTPNKVAAIAYRNTPGVERAWAYKAQNPNTDVYFTTVDKIKSDISALINKYDDFVFFNGSAANVVMTQIKAKYKNFYTVDIYEAFLHELKAGNGFFKCIAAQNTFEMAGAAVSAILNKTDKDQMVAPLYFSKDNLDDSELKPYLEFYHIR